MKVVYRKKEGKQCLSKLKSSLIDIEDMLEDHIAKDNEVRDLKKDGIEKWTLKVIWTKLFYY